jgi:hypothetical protein
VNVVTIAASTAGTTRSATRRSVSKSSRPRTARPPEMRSTSATILASRPDGTQLWVTLDFQAFGTITLRGGSGSMPTYNMGAFAVSRDQVRVYSSLPDVGTFQQILIGGSFVN